ncbi:transcriptional regulator GlcC [Halomonas sp. WWR20]
MGMSSPQASPRMPDTVATKIEKLILDGVIKPGQALPSERRLCEKLGVSRASLREGLRVLRGRGIIDTQQGRGSFVAQLLPSRDDSPMMHMFRDHPRTLYDLLEVRALLEGESSRLAALRGTPADFVLITRRYEELLALIETDDEVDVPTLARLDHAFHLAICEASHNPVLVHTLQGLSDLWLSSVFASVKNLYHRPGPRAQINHQHARLYRAVIERKPDLAWQVAQEHLHSVRDNLRDIEAEDERLERAAMRLEGWA